MTATNDRRPAKLNRRWVLAAGSALAVFTGSGAARAQDATPAGTTDTGEWTFTDDRGTTVTLPEPPERIVAAIAMASALWDYGIRPVGVWGTTRRGDGSPEITVGNLDLDAVVALGEEYGTFDLEALVALDPDLIVGAMWSDAPDVFGVPPETLGQIQSLAPIVDIRFVDQPVSTTLRRTQDLAVALGADLDDPEVAAARDRFDRAEAALQAAIAAKPGLSAVFVAPTTDLLYVADSTGADIRYFRDLGLDVIQPTGEASGGWESLSWEQAGKYRADVMLIDARASILTQDQLAAIATWSTLPAVQAGQLGPWDIEYIPSYTSFAPILERLTDSIRAADPDIVP